MTEVFGILTSFLEEQHIRDHLSTGILLESGIRQPDGTEEVRFIVNVLSPFIAGLLHGTGTGNEYTDTTRL